MLDGAFHILKITVVVAIGLVFFSAILALLSVIQSVVFSSVVGEVFLIISACLPFNAMAVFGAIGVSTSAIFAFLVAKKIFDLTSWSVSAV